MLKITLTNSKSPSTKALWNLAWFSWWCLAWKGSAVGGWWRGTPPPAPEIWFNCRCRWFWNLCLSSDDSCGDCWGVAGLCWGALCCDGDTLAFGDALEWALVGASPPESLWEGDTWGWPLPWTKQKGDGRCVIFTAIATKCYHLGCDTASFLAHPVYSWSWRWKQYISSKSW
jgi:hypothetical protein